MLLAAFLSAAAGCNARRIEYSVPSLVKTLKEDKDPNMRYWAAESLGKFGPEAQSAVPDPLLELDQIYLKAAKLFVIVLPRKDGLSLRSFPPLRVAWLRRLCHLMAAM